MLHGHRQPEDGRSQVRQRCLAELTFKVIQLGREHGMCEVNVFTVVNYFIIHIKTNPPRVSSKWTSLRAFTRVDYGQAT